MAMPLATGRSGTGKRTWPLETCLAILAGLQSEVFMPRYYIEMRSRFEFVEDLEGIDLPDADAARDEALRVATHKFCSTWQDMLSEFGDDIAIEVVTETGQTLLVVPLWEIKQHLEVV